MIRIISLLLFLSSTTFAQGLFKLTGEVQNPTQRKVILTLYRDWVGDEEDYELVLNEQNQFSFSTNLNHIAYIDFYYADQGFHFWIIEPLDEISIKIDPTNFWGSFQPTGKGSEKWLYYANHRNKFEVERDWEKEADNWRKTSIDNYFSELDKEQVKQIALLGEAQNLTQPFKDARNADIIGTMQNYKVELLSNVKYADWTEQKVRDTLKMGEVPPITQDNALEYGNSYLNLIDLLISKAAEQRKKEYSETEEYNSIKALYTSKQISRELTERMLAIKLKNMLDANPMNTKIQAIVNDYLTLSLNRDYNNFLTKKISFQKTLAKGSAAKPFTLTDIDGKSVSLKDFKGKVVYLDFWASWCGPCIYDLKFLEQVKEYFKDKEVVFIHISVDTEADWKEAVKTYNVKGINLQVNDASPVAKRYGVTGIPTYFLIDKNGNFAVSQANNPSDEDGKTLILQIEEILARK